MRTCSSGSLIKQYAELGYFGLSVPEKYGGHELGNLAMILTTEELSRASLAAAGSLTRVRDPREGAARRRHRGAEADVAAEARVGRSAWPPSA